MLKSVKEDIPRQSMQLIAVADQSTCFLRNKKEQRIQSFYVPNEYNKTRRSPIDKEEKRTSNIKLFQLISNQQQQYEISRQLVALSNENNFLSDKLMSSEERVTKWRREFRDLHNKFIQAINDLNNTQEELEDTRRMLAESEHIRSRWFLKTSPQDEYTNCAILSKKPSSSPPTQPHPHHSHSLPSNILRFLKINPKKL